MNTEKYSEYYREMGAHHCECGGEKGFRFAVFAPHAAAVSVVGDFNGWSSGKNPLVRGEKGVFKGFIPGLKQGDLYKFAIETSDGRLLFKADPFAFHSEMRPGTASILWNQPGISPEYAELRKKYRWTYSPNRPINIYEVHLGSWDSGEFDVVSRKLVDYCVDMGYTHIELLPIAEYPLDDSWGYQITGYFSATARYGTPEQLIKFIKYAHENRIGVIVDWVAAHFTKDEHGLRQFDGEPLFEPKDSLRSEMPQWGTLLFDYGREEVRRFLISNAIFWLKEFDVDGLRVDAVSCMLYHDFCRSEWKPNKFGGRENLEAIEFIKELNSVVHEVCPGKLMIAEESSAFDGVTRPVPDGGLGFDYKWNMGFMNDTLKYFELDCLYRPYHHEYLTFPMMYAFNERFILPFSHDEVVHGKKSLVNKQHGDYGAKFAQLKLMLAYQFAHPGKKLNFMGNEFGQFIEWDFRRPLDWFLLSYPSHKDMQDFSRSLNRFYLTHPALHNEENGWHGFKWLTVDDNENCVIAFVRSNGGERLIAVFNFHPAAHEKYRINIGEICRGVARARCVFSTHIGRSEVILAKKVRLGERYIEIPLDGYEAAFYTVVGNMLPISPD